MKIASLLSFWKKWKFIGSPSFLAVLMPIANQIVGKEFLRNQRLSYAHAAKIIQRIIIALIIAIVAVVIFITIGFVWIISNLAS